MKIKTAFHFDTASLHVGIIQHGELLAERLKLFHIDLRPGTFRLSVLTGRQRTALPPQ